MPKTPPQKDRFDDLPVAGDAASRIGAHRAETIPAMPGAEMLAALPRRRGLYRNMAKRAMDVTAILLAAPVVVPVVAALAVMVARDGGRPFYSQMRVGKDGRRFRMWKLRSMYQDADARRAALLQDNECDGIIFKQKNDPRITPVGRFIRRYSIDELPQLWNVVRGDMSLIGPRPALPEEVAQYDDLVARRLLVTPGLTGLWQVSGRSNLSWDRTVELDLRYVDNRTLTMDAKIMAATGRAVFGASGAY